MQRSPSCSSASSSASSVSAGSISLRTSEDPAGGPAPPSDLLSPPQPFDAFLSTPVESNMTFVSQFMMLSTEERAKLLFSLEGMGGLAEEQVSAEEEAERRRSLQQAVEAYDATMACGMGVDGVLLNGGAGLKAGGGAPLTGCPRDATVAVLSDEEDIVLDVDAVVPEVRTGYMTTLFTDTTPSPSNHKGKKHRHQSAVVTNALHGDAYRGSTRSSSRGSDSPELPPVLFDTFNLEQADEERDQLQWRQQHQQPTRRAPSYSAKEVERGGGAVYSRGKGGGAAEFRGDDAPPTPTPSTKEFLVPSLDEFLSLDPEVPPPPPPDAPAEATGEECAHLIPSAPPTSTAVAHRDPVAAGLMLGMKKSNKRSDEREEEEEKENESVSSRSISIAMSHSHSFSRSSSSASSSNSVGVSALLPGLEPLPEISSVNVGETHSLIHSDKSEHHLESLPPTHNNTAGEQVPLATQMEETSNKSHNNESHPGRTRNFLGVAATGSDIPLLQPAGTYTNIAHAALEALQDIINEVSDDVVPFTADPYDEAEEDRYLEGAALKQFNGDWKAYRLASVDHSN